MAKDIVVGEAFETRVKKAFGTASERIVCYLEQVTDQQEHAAMVSVLFSEPVLSLFAKLRPDMKFSRTGAIIRDTIQIGSYDSGMFVPTLKFLDKVFASDSDQKTKELLAMLSLYHLTEVIYSIRYLKPENMAVTRPIYFVALGCIDSTFERKGPEGVFAVLNEFDKIYDASWKEYYRTLSRPLANLAAAIAVETGASRDDAIFKAKLHLRGNGQFDGPTLTRNARFLDGISKLGYRISMR